LKKYRNLVRYSGHINNYNIPVKTRATGTISKLLRQYLSEIKGKEEIKELHKKNSHIGHCTLTAESANKDVQNISRVRNNITCSTDCKCRTAATLYTVETCFVSGT
jgi:hypothetical protein